MLKTNYENIKRIASSSQRGFWRVQALSKVNKEIKNGNHHFEHIKSLITVNSERDPIYRNRLELDIIPFLRPVDLKKINSKKKLITKPSIFVTEVEKNYDYRNLISQIFLNEDEIMLYNQMPFFYLPVKKVRPRTATEKFYNSKKIEKEFNDKYELIQLYKESLQYLPKSVRNNNNLNLSNIIINNNNNNNFNNESSNNVFKFKRKINIKSIDNIIKNNDNNIIKNNDNNIIKNNDYNIIKNNDNNIIKNNDNNERFLPNIKIKKLKSIDSGFDFKTRNKKYFNRNTSNQRYHISTDTKTNSNLFSVSPYQLSGNNNSKKIKINKYLK